MFTHLLVPLDGSTLAEAALPAARNLAEVFGAKVTLIHIIERNAPSAVHGERHLTNRDDALAYLVQVAQRAFPDSMNIETHVHTEDVEKVAPSIVEHSHELGVDLTVLTTHGKGNVRGALFGSIAQRVISMDTTPVLVIRPDETGHSAPFNCKQLLVPLDGNPDHEQGIGVAADLANKCNATVHFILIVPTLDTLRGERAATATLLPGTTSALLEETEAGATQYLAAQIERLRTQGIAATSDVRRGDPATCIAETAQRHESGIIIVSTHGKIGLDAFWAGSVAPEILRKTQIPTLLIRANAGPSEQ